MLCGGLGTRLRERVPGVPKALAPISGRPFLEYLLKDLVSAGFQRVILCTGIGGSQIRERFGDGTRIGAEIRYSEETKSLGTGGALKHAERLIATDPFLVMNGDTLTAVDYELLLRRHRREKAMVTLALAQVEDGERYGNVMVMPNGQVAELAEKAPVGSPVGGTVAERVWIYAGVCAMNRAVLEEIPVAPPAVSLEREILPRFLGKGLYAQPCDGFFLDIGIPEDYEHACRVIPKRYESAGTNTR